MESVSQSMNEVYYFNLFLITTPLRHTAGVEIEPRIF